MEGETRPPAPPDPSAPTSAWFRQVTFHGVLAGLCPLIPIPFVDDKVLVWVRRRMVRDVLRDHGLEPSQEQVRILEGSIEKSFLDGCLRTAFLLPLLKISTYLLRKVFRKILIVLTLKECSDRFSEALHEGYLLHRAAAEWEGGDATGVKQVRAAIRQACDEVDPRPVHQLAKKTFRGSRKLLVQAARRLTRVVRSERKVQAEAGREQEDPQIDVAAEESLVGSMADRLASSLWLQKAYWETLEGHFRRALSSGGEDPAGRRG